MSPYDMRDKLLFEAHLCLTKTGSLILDSVDDTLFVQSLDCIALAAHSNYQNLALDTIEKLNIELLKLNEKLVLLEKESQKSDKERSNNNGIFF